MDQNNQDTPFIVDENYVEVDPFQWANNLVQYKDELKIELFLINKNHILYRTNISGELTKQLEPLFIDGLLEYILDGAETGLTVRGFEKAEAETGVLQRALLSKVEKAKETLNWLKMQEHVLEIFSEEEHDFRRMKGILARVSHPEMDKPFYVAKVLPQSNIMQGKSGWMLKNGKFVAFDADAAMRIPNDNQLLIVDQDIFVFNQAKLKQLFGYDAKEASIAEKKVAEIQANFKLSFADGLSLQNLVAGKRSIIKKLQLIEPSLIKQQELMDHAEELGLNLMIDDSGAIIIMDEKDLATFVNLLNDDYVESNLTGQKYEIIKKKQIKIKDQDAQL